MASNTIITIARQYGSGGREIGSKLADLMGIQFYDKELITISAKKFGMNPDTLRQVDEKATNSLLYTLAVGSSFFQNPVIGYDIPINDKLFIAQSDVIRELADTSPCIIVGRCADYVLREYPNCVRVFIYADDEYRIKKIAAEANITDNEARDVMVKTDKRRNNYYNYYTGQKWGRNENYDISINTSKIGTDKAAELIWFYTKLKSK